MARSRPVRGSTGRPGRCGNNEPTESADTSRIIGRIGDEGFGLREPPQPPSKASTIGYRMAWVTHEPRCSRIGPSLTFAIIAAPSRSTKNVNTTKSRQPGDMLRSFFRLKSPSTPIGDPRVDATWFGQRHTRVGTLAKRTIGPRTAPGLRWLEINLRQGSQMASQLELSARAALCKQLAKREPENRVLWMAEAENWSRLSNEKLRGEPEQKPVTASWPISA